jgi:polysaccharide deacetylase 2 family uncharacterized protein YibQ
VRVVSLLVILFALCALAGGYFSGSAAVPRISLQFPSPNPVTSSEPLDVRPIRGLEVPQTDELAIDDFASDPAVVSNADGGDIQQDAHLAVVLVTCGHSIALESPFLSLGIPLALVIDPEAPAAHAIAGAANSAGKTVFVQVHAPLMLSDVQGLRAGFAHAAGIAARLESVPSRDVLRSLREQHLAVFDQFGDAAAVRRAMHAAGIAYFSRTITVDDHLQPAYVQYMLDQAVHLGRGSTAVVMARPLPGTLHALQTVIAQSSRDGVAFEPAIR